MFDGNLIVFGYYGLSSFHMSFVLYLIFNGFLHSFAIRAPIIKFRPFIVAASGN